MYIKFFVIFLRALKTVLVCSVCSLHVSWHHWVYSLKGSIGLFVTVCNKIHTGIAPLLFWANTMPYFCIWSRNRFFSSKMSWTLSSMTLESKQRHIDVDATSWRHIDVDVTSWCLVRLCASWVSTMFSLQASHPRKDSTASSTGVEYLRKTTLCWPNSHKKASTSAATMGD